MVPLAVASSIILCKKARLPDRPINGGTFSIRKNGKFLGFLQRWLYFGLLECVLGRSIQQPLFAGKESYLSSQNLLQLTNEYMASRPDQEPNRGELRAVLVVARRTHLDLFSHRTLPKGTVTHLQDDVFLQTFIENVSIEDPRDPSTVIAISLLIEFLQNLLLRKWGGIFTTSVDHPRMREPKTGPLWQALKRNGWCPSEAAAIVERFSVSGVYYMTQIRPPNPSRQDSAFTTNAIFDNLMMLHIKQSTITALETAEPVSADPNDLESILIDQNTIPLIRTPNTPWLNTQKAPEIVLKPWNGSEPFVAISHVWTDGLGNPNANELPRCQMHRLSDMVRDLTGRRDTLFWLGTICVPPDTALKNMNPTISKRQRQAQDQAIVKMRQTYEESSHVLVLDSWVISDTVKAMSDVEKLMRIFSSGWNTRL